MDVTNVVKPLQDPVISNIIIEHILDRNLINVINVVKYNHKGEDSKFSARDKSNEYNHE